MYVSHISSATQSLQPVPRCSAPVARLFTMLRTSSDDTANGVSSVRGSIAFILENCQLEVDSDQDSFRV